MSSNNKYLLFVLIFSISIISLPSQFSFGDAGTVSVDSFDVDYNIENGILDTIFLDSDFVEIILTMDTSSDGTVEITIPRSLLDVKFDTLDDEFFVLVDGFETDYAEINSTSEYRTLVIPFLAVILLLILLELMHSIPLPQNLKSHLGLRIMLTGGQMVK